MRRFLTPRWLLRHALMLVAVAGCVALGWWQVGRAQGGNSLSFGYAIEWPVFALFVIFIWAREIRLERRAGAPARVAPEPARDSLLTTVPPANRRPADVPEDDSATREYNDYLAWLAEDPTRRPSDYHRSR